MANRNEKNTPPPAVQTVERITSVLGAGVIWQGSINGSGGVRIEGTFEGQIALKGLLVVGETGKVTCENIRAANVIVAGAVKGNVTAQKVEIRALRACLGRYCHHRFCHRRRGLPARPDPDGRRRGPWPGCSHRK